MPQSLLSLWSTVFRAAARGGLLLLGLALLTTHSNAQSPPGWAWLKAINGYNSSTYEGNSCSALGHDAAGNLYVAGTFVGIATFDANAQAFSEGEDDIFLAKYSPSGSLIWLRQFRGRGQDKVLDLAVDATGNTVVVGTYGELTGDNLAAPDGQVLQGPRAYGAPASGSIYSAFPFIAALDAQGNTRWATRVSPTYSVRSTRLTSGSNSGLVLDRQGNSYWSASMDRDIVIGGQTYTRIGSVRDAFLLSYTASGQVRWFRQVGSTGDVRGGAVRRDRAGALYWQIHHANQTIDLPVGAGQVSSSQNNTLVKLTSSGAAKWLRPGWPTVGANNLQGNTLLSSDTTSNGLYAEVSTSINRTLTFNGSAAPIALPAGQIGSVLVRTDTSGYATWAKLVVTSSTVRANPPSINSASATADGGVVLTTTVSVLSSYELPAPQPFDASGGVHAVLKYQPASGTFAWLRSFGVPPTSTGPYSVFRSAAVDPAGNAYVAGWFIGTAYFGPLSATTGGGNSHGFLAKLDQTVLTTRPRQGQLPWSVYPNPATDQCWLSGLPPRTAVDVVDALGRRVRTFQATAGSTGVSVRGLAPGLYLIQPTDSRFAPLRLLVQ